MAGVDRVTPRKATKSEARRALELTAMEMIAEFRGDDTLGARWVKDDYKDRQESVTKRLEAKPVYLRIEEKWREADMGMYFKDIDYTPEEEEFINTDPDYLEMGRLFNDEYAALDAEKKQFLKRMKSGVMPPDEQKVFEDAEIGAYDPGKDSRAKAQLRFDSVFYEALNYEDSTKWDCRFDYRLSKIGCYREPRDHSIHDIYCDRRKRDNNGYKEKYLELQPWCEGFLQWLR